jgi:plastocyanin
MRRSVVWGFVVALAMGGVACSSGGGDDASCESPTATTDVTMTDFAYTPACVEASEGDMLTVVNSGETPHTFTVTGVDLDVDVAAGASDELSLDGVTAGTTYEVICTYRPQMVAALKVV